MATSAGTESGAGGRSLAAGAATPALVAAREVSRFYRLGAAVVPAVREVSLEVRRGEFVALQGPSGSGKPTLLNLLGLRDRPDQGEIAVAGEDSNALSEDARSDLRRDRFGFVFQTFNLLAVLSAEENVAYPMALAGVAAEERSRRAREQRVAIARALANRPEVVFADEPTANLDSHTADGILDLMREVSESGGVAFLFATHDPRVVARARRVVSLHDGRIESDVPR